MTISKLPLLTTPALFLTSTLVTEALPKKPNIVLIMADDMGYSDIGCYGSEIKTPNLDRLAKSGIRYTQLYNTAKSMPSRSSLLTGRYTNGRTWSKNFNHGPLIGEVLKTQGYRTLWSGKNHSSVRPPSRGFDRYYGFQGGCCNFWNPGPRMKDGSKLPHIKHYEWMVDDKWIPEFIPEEGYYMTDAITDNALSWLNQYKKEKSPFFLYLAYNSPHWPLHAKPEDIAKYKGVYDAGHKAIRAARYKRMVDSGLVKPSDSPLFEEKLPEWNSLPEKKRKLEAQRMEIHAAMVDNLDQNIGRVLDFIEKNGEMDNTLICFFVDNGASHEVDMRAFRNYKPTGKEEPGTVLTYDCIGPYWAKTINAPLAKHKMTNHEGGVRSPLIAHWPQVIKKKGIYRKAPVHLVDFMSTVIELSGGKYPKEFNGKKTKPIEGVSLVPSFFGKDLAKRQVPIGFNYGGRGVRFDGWKLVSYKNGPWELYNMKKDSTETNNLSKKMPEKVKELEKVYQEWLNTVKKQP